MRFAQRLHSRAVTFTSTHIVDRVRVPSRGTASGSIVAAAATDVVTSNKAGFDAVQEWFEIEETSGTDAQALDYLSADGGWPVVQARICWVWIPVPKDDLAHASYDDSAVG